MKISSENLPNSLVDLQNLCSELRGENEWLKRSLQQMEEMIRLLRHQRFGAKSEQSQHPGMMPLFPEPEPKEPVQTPSKDVTVPEHTRTITPRKPFPDSLPRVIETIDLAEGEKFCSCCGEASPLRKVSEEVSEKLNIVPATYHVIRYIRPVYSCRHCERMKVMPMPSHPIPKCSVTPSSLAQIAVSKYMDSLPLYRQEQIFSRSGIELSRDQMARWMIQIAEKLRPIYALLHKQLLSGPILHMDETTLQVLREEGRLPTAKSYMVVQARGDPEGKAIVLFHYSPSRSKNAMAPLLQGYKGILLTDGLEVYNSYCRASDEILHAGCWSHARRKFTEALKATKASNRKGNLAGMGLSLIDRLFAIESLAKDFSVEEREAMRHEKSAPILEEFKAWLSNHIATVPSKSLVGVAMAYTMRQWEKLVVFLTSGQIPIHNNFVENAIRPYAIGRKNWLFSSSEDGAEANAILYSLLSTAKVNGLHPIDYLTRAMLGLAAGQAADEFLPFAAIH